MKVLVIDDNPTNLEVARALLGDKHDVTVASNYEEAQKLLGFIYGVSDAPNAHTFDVVLTDLLMPGPHLMNQGTDEEMPVGMFLAVLAAKNGAKYVGLLTDSSHHSHPASECIDAIEGYESDPATFTIEGATVVFANTRNWINTFNPETFQLIKYREPGYETGIRAKNWRILLSWLTGEWDERDDD